MNTVRRVSYVFLCIVPFLSFAVVGVRLSRPRSLSGRRSSVLCNDRDRSVDAWQRKAAAAFGQKATAAFSWWSASRARSRRQ